MKQPILLAAFLLLASSFTAKAQPEFPDSLSAKETGNSYRDTSETFLTIGANTLWNNDGFRAYSGEIGILHGERVSSHIGYIGFLGMRYTAELTSVDKKLVGGLKAGYEASGLVFSFRGSVGIFSDFNKKYTPVLVPEVGISGVGHVNFTIGMVMPIGGIRVLPFSTRLSLSVNFL